jgi:chorismate dehydratase
MKLGHIDYLNSYPFYYQMFQKKPLKGILVYSDYPSVLNKMMTKGDLDMSPISSIICADISDDILLLPQFCLSSIGYVGSVILVSQFPIEDLDGKRVGLTRASNTSVVLLKILMKKYYHLEPVYEQSDPRPTLEGIDAALVIGNEAMVKLSKPASYTYDLGDLWHRKTGNPVVFAVFAVRKAVVERYRAQIREVIESYSQSLRCLQKEKADLILKAKERYPDILYDIDNYYDQLKFEFTEDLRKAFMFYLGAAGDLGLTKKISRLNYLTL